VLCAVLLLQLHLVYNMASERAAQQWNSSSCSILTCNVLIIVLLAKQASLPVLYCCVAPLQGVCLQQ
jgi:hypothetical protein